LLDAIAFAVFVGYEVLAFTTAFSEQFALPKLLGLYAYAAFASVRWGAALRQGRVGRLPRSMAVAAVALALWWIATTVTAQHVATAIFGMRGRYNGLAAMLAGLVIFVSLATARFTDSEIEWRLIGVCAVLTIAAVYAFVQEAGLDGIAWPPGRPPSSLGHPVIFGGALAMVLPFALAFALDGRTRAARLACGGMVVALGLALTLTLARGPWIGALCGAAAFAALAGVRGPRFATRLAGLAGAALLLVAAVLGFSAPARARVLDRVATFGALSGDVSVAYRAHFYGAALAMLRDHPVVGVGWENFGLLYPEYRSKPAGAIAADVAPTMVHSGPLQTAVSGGVPALVLQLLFLGAIGVSGARRWRAETGGRPRLIGAAFLASGVAYFVQDLSGWPHVALGALVSVLAGLEVSWSRAGRPFSPAPRRWPLVGLAVATAFACGWLALDTWSRIRAERLVFEAEQLDVRTSWSSIEARLRAALDVSPDRAWASAAAARLYLQRASASADRRSYEKGVALTEAAREANPFDPYVRLRRAEFDLVAIDRGILAGLTDEGREALGDARSMTKDSAMVGRVEASLAREAGNSRISWIAPSARAGFGPAGSLVIAGSAPRGLPGTHVFLHWRNVTRKSAWTTEADAPAPRADGAWYGAIPDARYGDRYEVYATAETWFQGPCTYPGNGSPHLCAPIAFIGPDTSGVGPPGSLIVAGALPETEAGTEVQLHRRNATRRASWTLAPFRPDASGQRIVFPSDAPGNWYSILLDGHAGERYDVALSTPARTLESCAYVGDGLRQFCAPLAWIQPQALSGYGPPGSLEVAGFAPEAWGQAPIFLHWRNATRKTAWTTAEYAPVPDSKRAWYNFIPDANLADRYQVCITSPTSATTTCVYTGDGSVNACP
jgi:O-antigen ligase